MLGRFKAKPQIPQFPPQAAEVAQPPAPWLRASALMISSHAQSGSTKSPRVSASSRRALGLIRGTSVQSRYGSGLVPKAGGTSSGPGGDMDIPAMFRRAAAEFNQYAGAPSGTGRRHSTC